MDGTDNPPLSKMFAWVKTLLKETFNDPSGYIVFDQSFDSRPRIKYYEMLK